MQCILSKNCPIRQEETVILTDQLQFFMKEAGFF